MTKDIDIRAMLEKVIPLQKPLCDMTMPERRAVGHVYCPKKTVFAPKPFKRKYTPEERLAARRASCHRRYMRNKEYYKARNHEYYIAHKNEVNGRSADWHKRHPECHKKAVKKWYLAHKTR